MSEKCLDVGKKNCKMFMEAYSISDIPHMILIGRGGKNRNTQCMKRNILICLFLSIGFISCKKNNDGSFFIKGTITGFKDSTLIEIRYDTFEKNDWITITDSTRVIGGRFSFQGNIKDVTVARLDFPNRFIRIYIEPTSMNLHIDGNKPYRYRLTGTMVEKENIELRQCLQPYMEFYYKSLDRIINLSHEIDLSQEGSPVRDSLIRIGDSIFAMNEINSYKRDSIQLDFAAKHPYYRITPDLLHSVSETDNVSIDSVLAVYNILADEIKNSRMGKLVLKEIQEHEKKKRILNSTSIGFYPFDFIRKSFSGDTIQLSDYKHKTYVLLDFWASWCIPCLKEVPKMKEICKEYQNKGLTVIGISLDEDKNSWRKAIQKQQMDGWSQILSIRWNDENSDDSFMESALSEIYGCTEIPFYVLIDKDGKVVAKWEHIGEGELNLLNSIFIK